ncbi:MAG: hypothetical protein WB820_01915 [Rhodoplanes sp.]
MVRRLDPQLDYPRARRRCGRLDIAAIAGQLVGGGAAGAIVTAIVGAVMNAMKK